MEPVRPGVEVADGFASRAPPLNGAVAINNDETMGEPEADRDLNGAL